MKTSTTNTRFWELVKSFDPPTDDSGGGTEPPETPPFNKDPEGVHIPTWFKYLCAFLVGAISMNLLYFAPMALPFLALAGIAVFTLFAASRRWT